MCASVCRIISFHIQYIILYCQVLIIEMYTWQCFVYNAQNLVTNVFRKTSSHGSKTVVTLVNKPWYGYHDYYCIYIVTANNSVDMYSAVVSPGLRSSVETWDISNCWYFHCCFSSLRRESTYLLPFCDLVHRSPVPQVLWVKNKTKWNYLHPRLMSLSTHYLLGP